MRKTIVFLLLNVIIFPVISQEKPQLTEEETFAYIKKYYDNMDGCYSPTTSDNHTYTLSTSDCSFAILGDCVKFQFRIYNECDDCGWNGEASSTSVSRTYIFNPAKIKDIRISYDNIIGVPAGVEFKNATKYLIELTDYSGKESGYGTSNSNTNEIIVYCYSNANDGFTFEKVRKAWLYLSELWKINHIQNKDPFE